MYDVGNLVLAVQKAPEQFRECRNARPGPAGSGPLHAFLLDDGGDIFAEFNAVAGQFDAPYRRKSFGPSVYGFAIGSDLKQRSNEFAEVHLVAPPIDEAPDDRLAERALQRKRQVRFAWAARGEVVKGNHWGISTSAAHEDNLRCSRPDVHGARTPLRA
ncbi:MAG: hypothetical protein IT377_13265 [Polyangiaceae bacterium]|nr:hypothetical protein [Polyangiaceae bacterium]